MIDIPLYLRRLSGNILGRVLFFTAIKTVSTKKEHPETKRESENFPSSSGERESEVPSSDPNSVPRAVFVPFASRPQTGSWGETRPETEVGCRISMHSPEIIALDDFRVVL